MWMEQTSRKLQWIELPKPLYSYDRQLCRVFCYNHNKVSLVSSDLHQPKHTQLSNFVWRAGTGVVWFSSLSRRREPSTSKWKGPLGTLPTWLLPHIPLVKKEPPRTLMVLLLLFAFTGWQSMLNQMSPVLLWVGRETNHLYVLPCKGLRVPWSKLEIFSTLHFMNFTWCCTWSSLHLWRRSPSTHH